MPRNPTTWDEYQYGSSPRGSISSIEDRSVHFSEVGGIPPADSPYLDIPHDEGEDVEGAGLRRRR
jgi:vesicular inhibitory amino acid transporter